LLRLKISLPQSAAQALSNDVKKRRKTNFCSKFELLAPYFNWQKKWFFFLILFLSFKEQENKYNPHRDRQIKKKDSDDSGRCFIIILTEKKKSRLFYSNNV